MDKITIAKGDGIGPEIMDAKLAIMEAAGTRLKTENLYAFEGVRSFSLGQGQ